MNMENTKNSILMFYEFETEVSRACKKNDTTVLDRLIANDFEGITRDGKKIDKKEINALGLQDITGFLEFNEKSLDEHVGRVDYECSGKLGVEKRFSLWQNTNGWQLKYHQITPIKGKLPVDPVKNLPKERL